MDPSRKLYRVAERTEGLKLGLQDVRLNRVFEGPGRTCERARSRWCWEFWFPDA